MALISRLGQFFGGRQPSNIEPVRPTKAQGTVGYNITGGYLAVKEKNNALVGKQRYITFADILQNTAIVAAGTRYFLNIIAQPEWSVEPARDLGDDSSDEAKRIAEIVETMLFDELATNWTRLVRRSGQYRYYGFAIEEWTAAKRADGLIGIKDVQPRPQHTIERWDISEAGDVLGVWQTSPQTGRELYIPRQKFVYLLDDTLTDSPEGMGLFRQVTEASRRLQELVRLEATGYSRDMRGLPILRAPLAEMQRQNLSEEEKSSALSALKSFGGLETKDTDTYLLLDSEPFRSTTENGENVSSTPMWNVEFAKVTASGLDEIGKAIERLNQEIARVLGVEGLMLGAGASGSRAAAEDKSSNLHLQANSALDDIQEAMERDLVGAIMTLNGFPDALKPRLSHESVQKKDVEAMAAALKNIATAGVPLMREDEAVREFFNEIGLTPPEADEMAALMDEAGQEGVNVGPDDEQGGFGEPSEDIQ